MVAEDRIIHWVLPLICLSLILGFVGTSMSSTTKSIYLPNGRIISDPSDMHVSELAHLMVESCDMATYALREYLKQGNSKNGKESQVLLKMYKKNELTAQKVFGMLRLKSHEAGPGYINILFPEGKGVLFHNSYEYQRLTRFLDYVSRESHGRKVVLVLVGTAPASLAESSNGSGVLARRRVEASIKIIDRYLANIPHVFFKAYCTGDIYNQSTYMDETIGTQNVYVVAVYDNTAEASPKERFKNSIGMEFVFIPPGSFTMGSPPSEYGHDLSERRHVVNFSKGFYMQTTEVTQGEWKAVIGSNPSFFLNGGDDCPVENINWFDAQEFIKKLNEREGTERYRLPTEAEWEYACRAGTNSSFANGGTITKKSMVKNDFLGQMGWYYENSQEATHPVAKKKPNGWGLYDMHGNVWEWCQDWMAKYPFEATIDPAGPPTGISRIRRGGSWQEYPVFCRSAYRSSSHPKNKGPNLGLRLAVSLEKPLSIPSGIYKEKVKKTPPPKECIFIRDIGFNLDSAKIKPEMRLVLDKAVDILKMHSGEILVEGYTCSIGSEKYNKALSERRAAAVKNYLVKKGISATRIKTIGYGKERPKFTNKNEEGRRLNRRVEIHLIPEVK